MPQRSENRSGIQPSHTDPFHVLVFIRVTDPEHEHGVGERIQRRDNRHAIAQPDADAGVQAQVHVGDEHPLREDLRVVPGSLRNNPPLLR